MNVEDIMMLDDYDIDYTVLSDDVLGQLALGNELYIATSALNELSSRNPTLSVPIMITRKYLLRFGTTPSCSSLHYSILQAKYIICCQL